MKSVLITLYTEDVQKSLDFYNGLLEIPIIRRQTVGNGEELVFLGVGGIETLELVPADAGTAYAGFSIGIEVVDILTIKKRLEENGYPTEPIVSVNESTTLCFLEGPNGEKVELIEYK